jgi:VIT1/CCC1 family predicted Fe2+/Mn2+ transporter
MEKHVLDAIRNAQREEIEGYRIYSKLARRIKNEENSRVLNRLAEHELRHYEILKTYTGRDVKPSRFKIFLVTFMARLLGLVFSLKLMENGERNADEVYSEVGDHVPEVGQILRDEDSHERELIDMIDEEALDYMGSVVLGLNDALVELTGALAGFTFAIQKSQTIGLLGLITGIAATLSMAASEYLSQRQEGASGKAVKSSLYTGVAYIGTVVLLTVPFFVLANPFVSLALMMAIAIAVVLLFNYYISIAKDLPFKRRFAEMALISIGVALLSFGIGWLVRMVWGLEL